MLEFRVPYDMVLMEFVMDSIFDHEPRSNRGFKNCSVVVIVVLLFVLFQYFLINDAITFFSIDMPCTL